MKIPFVLSSGMPLLTLEVLHSSKLSNIKEQLRALFTSQVRDYMSNLREESNEPPVFRLRASPDERPLTTFAYVNSRTIQLFAYRGERLKDEQSVRSVAVPICILRPTDIVTTSCDMSGNTETTVFNTEEEVMWRDQTSPNFIELVFVSTRKKPFLCVAAYTETVSALLVRLQPLVSCSSDHLQLWNQGTPLLAGATVQSCGLRNRSRLAVQLPGEALAMAIDIRGNLAVFPVIGSEKPDDLIQKVRILQVEWKHMETLSQYFCTCSPYLFPIRYHVFSPQNVLLSLQFPDGHTEKVIIPAICSGEQVKKCIEMQHGLPAAIISLTLLGELSFEWSFRDLGVKDGEKLMILKKRTDQKDLKFVDIFKKYRRKRLWVSSNLTISQVKQVLKDKKFAHDSTLFLLKGTEILSDEATLSQCEIDENMPIFCGNEQEIAKRLAKLTPNYFIPPRKHSNCYENEPSFDLFESGQDPNRLTHAERLQRYQKEVNESINVRAIAPSTVLSLLVHTKATIGIVKAHLRTALKLASFKVMHGDKELKEELNFEEQGVTAGSDLLLVPPGTLRVTVSTGAGLRFPVVLQPLTTLHYLCPVLEKLTGLQFNSQRVLFTKELKDRDSVPTAIGALTALVNLAGS